ncbi:MAG: TolC family outer membrane protein [Aquisalimonadaceae bacterium]
MTRCKPGRSLPMGLLAAMLALAGQATAEPRDLMDIYTLAIERDPRLEAAQHRLRATDEVETQARALFLPQIDLEADSGYIWENSQIGSNPRNSADYDYWDAGIALTQPLFRMESFSLARQADIFTTQAALEFAQAQQDLMLRTSQAYFDVLLAQDQLSTVDGELLAIESELRRARRALEVGTGTITDVNEAQARFDRVQADRLRAENNLTVARETLHRLIGEPAGQLIGLEEEFTAQPPMPTERRAWAERAERYNITVRLTEQNLASAREDVNQEQAGRYPRVDLVARYGRSYQSDIGIGQPGLNGDIEREQTTVGVRVTMPLYTGGATTSRIRERQAQRDAVFSDTLDAKRNAALQAESAYLNLTSNLQQIRALEQALRSVLSTERSTQRGLEVGLRTTLDVLDVQRERFEIERQLAEARYAYLLNYLQLQVAVGGGVDDTSIEDVNFFLTRMPDGDSE